jgi:chromosome segregation ATPase
MSTFTQVQLNSMTLDELERYYNLDPNDLGICNAYIAKFNEAEDLNNETISELQSDLDAANETISELQSDLGVANEAMEELQSRLADYE